MRAYKFTRAGAIAQFTGRAYRPGEWVEAVDHPDRGVHAARAAHLPFWLDDELWVVELDGAIVERPTQIVAARGRLIERVDAWNADAGRALVDDVVTRAEARVARADVGWAPAGPPRAARTTGELESMRAAARDVHARLQGDRAALVGCWISLLGASARGAAATSAFIATALAAIERAGPSPSPDRKADVDEAVRDERRAQADHLVRALGLDSVL